MADFPSETMEIRRQGDDIFKVLKGKYYQLRILYLQNYPSKMEKFSYYKKTEKREYVASRHGKGSPSG